MRMDDAVPDVGVSCSGEKRPRDEADAEPPEARRARLEVLCDLMHGDLTREDNFEARLRYQPSERDGDGGAAGERGGRGPVRDLGE